jgi:nucleotide-binding universal stress UspA family protein
MTFRKILCPTDFSPGSEQALRVATSLASTEDSELVIVHAWYLPPSAYSLEYAFPPAVTQELMSEARDRVDGAVQVARASGAAQVSGQLVSGVPWMKIVETLESQAFDLCVIGTRGRTGLERILLGSVAEPVVRHAPCSVLAVHPDGEPRPFKNVLVPTDFSASAQHAIELAGAMVASNGAVTLLHVIELPVAYSGKLPVVGLERELARQASEWLDAAAKTLQTRTQARVGTLYRIGYPGAQTLAAIEADRAIDLVVMGSHGRTGIKRAIMGSVAEKVVRHAHCPVLIARRRA